MKILVLVLAIVLVASVAMGDELVPPFIKIRDIAQTKGTPVKSVEGAKLYECPIHLKEYSEIDSIQFIFISTNGNIGISVYNKYEEWSAVIWANEQKLYGLATRTRQEGLVKERLTQETAVMHAQIMLELAYKAGCVAQEIQAQNQVLCCCQSQFGGTCCSWMFPPCTGAYIPGCVCR